MQHFSELNLCPALRHNLEKNEFVTPTPVQAQAIPPLLEGRDVVATAQTGYDAGVLTQQFDPDVVILDFKLPDINGNVVCKTIRQNPELADIKILIISGVASPALMR